jgi:flagellar biosynthesis protein FliR
LAHASLVCVFGVHVYFFDSRSQHAHSHLLGICDGLMEISRQILIGLTLGLVFQVASAAMVVAGQAMSGSMGLSMANMVDPNMGSVPVLSQMLNIMGTLVFLGMGGHLIVFGLVLESFKLIPIGQPFFCLARDDDLVVHQHWPRICGARCTKLEYFYRGLSRAHLDRFCGHDVFDGQQRGPH